MASLYSDVLVMAERRGAKDMLDTLIALGALRIDHENQALLPGVSVPMEAVSRLCRSWGE